MAFLGAELDLNWLRNLSWQDFERQLASVYRQNGYQVEEIGGGGPDGGVDLKLFKDGCTTVVQCKHWKTWKVNVKPIRELLGVMTAEGADAAIFIVSGDYTSAAREFAKGKPIELIDREGFLELVCQFQRDLQNHYGVALTNQGQPAPTTSNAAPECPICQSPMKLRTARKGGSAGSQFWGCSKFPNCRGTRNCA
jgi:restriction system protein